MKEPGKEPNTKPSAKAGTTKVYACDAVETGFDYLIFSQSNALTQSIRTALKGNHKFRAELQPELKKVYYGTGSHVVGLQRQPQHHPKQTQQHTDATPVAADADAGTACETLRQVLEARAEIRCIEHERLLALVKTLYSQMHDLEQAHRHAVPYFGVDDVVVLNDAVALFINDDKLFAIRDGDGEATATATIDVTRAISRDGAFYPPELSDGNGNKTASLPYTVDARCAYYSFGMLVAYCATLNPVLLTHNSDKDRSRRRLKLKRDVLGPIEGTKLYWFIVRCCAADAAKRCMLYV